MSKLQLYSDLVKKRKACTTCTGVQNPSRCCEGSYDTEEIGPWSVWQGNLDAELLVVGQDWGDIKIFERQKGKDSDKSATNVFLRKLVGLAGFTIAPLATAQGRGLVFMTNAVLCLKEAGGSQGPVQSSWFSNCGKSFLLPLIEIVRPKIVVTLGEKAYRAIALAAGIPAMKFLDAVESKDGFVIQDGVRLFPRYHPSRRIRNTHRPDEKQREDWQRIANYLGVRS